MRKLLEKAKLEAKELETWPKYYDYRYYEIKKVLSRAKIKARNTLDHGCGNSFSTALLSTISRKVTAIDIPEADSASHSVGLQKALRLQKALETNAYFVGGIAEKLPFKDGKYDCVFSMFVLEHVKNKQKTVEEIYRVLGPRGKLILLIPNSTERIYAILYYYVHALKWILKRIRSKPVKTSAKKHIKKHGNFLVPPPHGNYKKFLEEYRAHKKKQWLALLNNKFTVEKTFAGMIYPLDFANALLGPELAFSIYKSSEKIVRILEKILGEKVMIPLANSLVIIARKE